ncbi:hypothetical protein K504DRAFT_462779 [Pleomassaria siparia CBS 279.74]|uniref:Uncharacterized protein n=1 Tax=Pleomassaria siparia CBS 279.74 TaxID=1314801 RepID=A0A6G1JUB8_9PLEO|nr:hypothetical protein K504DRAFT_462779 [Pleomassaria siparia CBS 279.74]
MNDSSSTSRGQSPPAEGPHSIYYMHPPDDPPPSYDDATHSSYTPLLVGPPPDYGTAYRAYPEPDASSVASSDIERSNRSLPEWVGQALVVFCFVAIIYGFFSLVNDTDNLPG